MVKEFIEMNHNERMSMICKQCEAANKKKEQKAFHEKIIKLVSQR